jgi:hypothetical protein
MVESVRLAHSDKAYRTWRAEVDRKHRSAGAKGLRQLIAAGSVREHPEFRN